MVKKTGSNAPGQSTDSTSIFDGKSLATPVVVDLSLPHINAAITQGKALRAEGKSKAETAQAIFAAIHSEPKEVLVAAFVEGAQLTPKGALTYWYNCRRKAAKAAKVAS